jgi:hypothetical protein
MVPGSFFVCNTTCVDFSKHDIIVFMDSKNLVEPKKRLHLSFTIVIVALAFLVGYFIYTKSFSTNTLQVDRAKAVLQKDSKFPQPETDLLETVSTSDLPENLKFLLPSGETYSNLVVKKMLISPDKNFYTLTFIQNDELFITHRELFIAISKAGGWKIMGGSRTDLAGTIEAENDKYQVRITDSFQDKSHTDVKIEVVKK